MILKLNNDGTITIQPQKVPENLKGVYIKYVFPKGLNHLSPVLTWGKEEYKGNNIFIKKKPIDFNMKVTLYDGEEVFKSYYNNETPTLFVAYHLDTIHPDMLEYIKMLELKVKELEEKGDVI